MAGWALRLAVEGHYSLFTSAWATQTLHWGSRKFRGQSRPTAGMFSAWLRFVLRRIAKWTVQGTFSTVPVVGTLLFLSVAWTWAEEIGPLLNRVTGRMMILMFSGL